MRDFTIATFIQAVQQSFSNNSQEAVGRLLLESISMRDDVKVDIDAKMVSNLVKRKKEVHDAIRNASVREDVINEVMDYFERDVLPELNPHNSQDALLKVSELLKSDTTVPMTKLDELLKYYDKGDVGNFLGHSFLYSINRQNVRADAPVESDDIPLLSEIGNKCPFCHKPLVKSVKGIPVKRYEKIYIFPLDLTDEEKDDFRKKLMPPKRLDTDENRTLLCQSCADDYVLSPDVNEYVKLLKLKQNYAKRYKVRTDIAQMDLEEEILDVIEALGTVKNVSGLQKLPLSALKIRQKMKDKDGPLHQDISDDVINYYKFIESEFSEAGCFEMIASEISVTYNKMEQNNFTQEEIYEELTEWIVNNSGLGQGHYLACRMIVAFFVQNCEVFREIS